MTHYKSPAELLRMLPAGELTRLALDAAVAAAVVGATTAEVDAAADAVITGAGATPNFKLVEGYAHATCTSVNDEVVHGIPGDRVLEHGDLLKIDCGAEVDGLNGDSARTVIVGDDGRAEASSPRIAERRALSTATQDAMWAGIAALSSAKHINEVGDAVEASIEANSDFGIVEDYIGHGIGYEMHEAPQVFNYAVRGRGVKVRPGLAVAIEPIICERDNATRTARDGWTVTMADGGDGCQWEHTVIVHDGGIWVTTAEDGGAAGLAPYGVRPVKPAAE